MTGPDVEVTLRIQAESLDKLSIDATEVGRVRAPLFLVEVEPNVYRLGGTLSGGRLKPIDVMREAGVADEVDELFLGGDRS